MIFILEKLDLFIGLVINKSRYDFLVVLEMILNEFVKLSFFQNLLLLFLFFLKLEMSYLVIFVFDLFCFGPYFIQRSQFTFYIYHSFDGLFLFIFHIRYFAFDQLLLRSRNTFITCSVYLFFCLS